MINANELRIGNFVNLIALDQMIQITSVSKTTGLAGLFTWVHDDTEHEDSLSGIQAIVLNPEILKSFGFESRVGMHKITYWYPNEDALWSIRKEGAKWQFCIEVEKDFIMKFDPIISGLHQLQNLYFALTGTELVFSDVLKMVKTT